MLTLILRLAHMKALLHPVTGSQVSLKSVDVPCIVPGYPRDGIFSRGRPSFPCTASVTGLHCTAAPAGSLSPRPGWWGKASVCLETWNRGPSHQHLTKSFVVSALYEIFLRVKETNQNNYSDPYYFMQAEVDIECVLVILWKSKCANFQLVSDNFVLYWYCRTVSLVCNGEKDDCFTSWAETTVLLLLYFPQFFLSVSTYPHRKQFWGWSFLLCSTFSYPHYVYLNIQDKILKPIPTFK